MSKLHKILINAQPYETRVCVLYGVEGESEGVSSERASSKKVSREELQEFQLERDPNHSLIGNIYKGKVARVLPDMQAAFVDIGLATNGFLPAAELLERRQSTTTLPIEEILHEGSAVWVQVTRDAIADKGPRLSAQLSIASSNLVYQPQAQGVAISRQIDEATVRSTLKENSEAMLADSNCEQGGLIIRTNAALATVEQLRNDLHHLLAAWQQTSDTMQQAKAGDLVYRPPSLAISFVRDYNHQDLDSIVVDSPQLQQQLQSTFPELKNITALHQNDKPLFEHYGVESQIEALHHAKVELESGANLIIEQTASMTTIDVNTALSSNRQGTSKAYQTNLTAVPEIARQLRLRNIGGIVLVDFIDMSRDQDKEAIVSVMQEYLALDRVTTTVGTISPLGLLEITRQRVRPSLQEIMGKPCDACGGLGVVKSAESVCYQIFRDLHSLASNKDGKTYNIVASANLIDLLQNQQAENLQNVQELLGQAINLRLDEQFSALHYEIVQS